MKIISIVGARPQFVKIKPMVDEFKKKKDVRHVVVNTGQHYDYEMSKIFFKELGIPKPDYSLEVGSHPAGKQRALILERAENILLREKPDAVIVYGDTNSTLAGALAAAGLNIPIAHVEAGLRSGRLDMPEEVNRILTDHVSSFLFCPTKTAVENLRKEGFKKNIFKPGDVMQDILNRYRNMLGKSKILKELALKPKGYVLLTIHRKENTDDPNTIRSLLRVLGNSKDRVVFPVHPRTEKILSRIDIARYLKCKNISFIKPVGYIDMLALEHNAMKILTDSGGVQKEAYWLKVPCVTLRDETEWQETVDDGWNLLTGTDAGRVKKALSHFSPRGRAKSVAVTKNNKAAAQIVDTLVKALR